MDIREIATQLQQEIEDELSDIMPLTQEEMEQVTGGGLPNLCDNGAAARA